MASNQARALGTTPDQSRSGHLGVVPRAPHEVGRTSSDEPASVPANILILVGHTAGGPDLFLVLHADQHDEGVGHTRRAVAVQIDGLLAVLVIDGVELSEIGAEGMAYLIPPFQRRGKLAADIAVNGRILGKKQELGLDILCVREIRKGVDEALEGRPVLELL